MKNVFLLGAAAQAIITGLLTLTKIIEFRPSQQFIVATLFILVYLILSSKRNKKKKLEPLIPKISLSDTRQLSNIGDINIAIYSMNTEGTANDFFNFFNISLDKLCISQKKLDENLERLLVLSSGSFIALFQEDNKYFVYYAFEDGVNILRLEDNWPFYPQKNIKVLVKRPM